ncbi:hypothetical protein [Serratia liquefaciens]|uniref:Uncharacterized protein n=1 Tax=Serratia liquefaciens TaxID=614 RepID=A0A515CTF6_SERLI|nr:hypothetical protein [Serratia liquefaciens]QDL31452.1 hypothetical protein EGO53_06505 [Serratia liquefaciens]
MSYSDVVATIAMIVSITAVPASGYVSYRFAIKGEKRKEFNAIADPIMESLMQQLERTKKGDPPWKTTQKEQINSLINISKPKDFNRIQDAYEAYQRALSECGKYINYGASYDFHSPHVLIEAIENLMPFVRHR